MRMETRLKPREEYESASGTGIPIPFNEQVRGQSEWLTSLAALDIP